MIFCPERLEIVRNKSVELQYHLYLGHKHLYIICSWQKTEGRWFCCKEHYWDNIINISASWKEMSQIKKGSNETLVPLSFMTIVHSVHAVRMQKNLNSALSHSGHVKRPSSEESLFVPSFILLLYTQTVSSTHHCHLIILSILSLCVCVLLCPLSHQLSYNTHHHCLMLR